MSLSKIKTKKIYINIHKNTPKKNTYICDIKTSALYLYIYMYMYQFLIKESQATTKYSWY